MKFHLDRIGKLRVFCLKGKGRGHVWPVSTHSRNKAYDVYRVCHKIFLAV